MAASSITRRSPRLAPDSRTYTVDGGEEERVLESVRFGYWAVARSGIYFIDFDVPSEAARPVRFFDFQSRRVKQVGTVENTVSLDQYARFRNQPG